MNFAGDNPSLSIAALQWVYGSTFTSGNRVELLWKNAQLFGHIFDMIRGAKELICLEFYIFRNDETGKELAEILKKKASEGVKVCVLYDHFGSIFTPREFWSGLRKAGVSVRASRPFKWARPFHYMHRDHKKLIIVDGVKAYTGGLNIANEYRGYHRKKKIRGWRDTGISLEGPISTTLLEMFKNTWKIWKGEPIRFSRVSEPIVNGLPVIPIFTSSSKDRRRMRKLLYHNITHAQKSIYLTTAYFTPSRRMLQVLSEAVMRGVDVKLLLSEKTDVEAALYAARSFFAKLLATGVEIYSYQGVVLHAKTYVFDGVWSVIGSANLDFQSLRKNDEGNVGVLDAKFGEEMIGVFNEDLKQSRRITLDKWLKRPLWDKVKEKFFALFRRRL